MDPIISPWLIWAIQTCSTVKVLLMITAVVLGIAIMIAACISIMSDVDEPEKIKATKVRNRLVIITLPIILLATAVPNTETAKWMLVSSYITEDNVNKAGETIKETIDYIFDKIESSSDKEAT